MFWPLNRLHTICCTISKRHWIPLMQLTDQFRVYMDLFSNASIFFSWHYWHFKCVLISHNMVGFLSWFSFNTVSSSNKHIQYVFEIQNTDTFDNRHYLWQVLNVLSGTSSLDFSMHCNYLSKRYEGHWIYHVI